jgi:alpha-amylase/alpha-mannosidase (GH57 family)
MTDEPLHVAVIWHMHQPYYRDPLTGVYRLPWVRLHGTKDYLDMVEMLRDFPLVRQNFNLVPSLLEQLIDYCENGATDIFLDASRRKASELSTEEKSFILENFFLANWENMIRIFPRYHELLMKRGMRVVKKDLARAVNYFTNGDFLDLQVLFNLAWIDPMFRETDPLLQSLVARGRNFTEEDKETLLAKQIDILGRIIPTYREMALSGQIELSFSPFYHPILPLLCSTDTAKAAMPDVRLPRQRFVHPEDADAQIADGISYFQKIFGFRPSGMWPPEGSVSQEALRLASRHGVKWTATDEGVLSLSLNRILRDPSGKVTEPDLLYRPYSFDDVSIVFRDHTLSDLIGFVYAQWEPRKAAADLIDRLLSIRNSMRAGKPRLVSIILDGENAWEYYRNDGRDFLLHLYEGLSREDRLRMITVSDFLAGHGGGERLGRLHAGSWINANFGIWIGHEEDNDAWDYLGEARDSLENHGKSKPGSALEEAWKAIYVAEGSDWNWWYGDEHVTETQEEFDELFRLNLMKVYREMGKDIPERLYVPILRRDREVTPSLAIRGFINPTIDGIVTSYYEWYQGAQLDVKKTGGSMHKSESLVAAVHYGFNRENLYIRIDPRIPFDEFGEGVVVSVVTSMPADMKADFSLGGREAALFERQAEGWREVKTLREVAARDIFEIGIPFFDLRAKEKDEIRMYLSISRSGEEVERCPWRGYVTVTVPTEDFEAMMWS